MNFEGELIGGKFVKRLNRFEAIVNISSRTYLAHVPNSGRLQELLIKDANILLKKSDNPLRKTAYSLILVEHKGIWVSIDSTNIPNRLVGEALINRQFKMFEEFTQVKREATYGNSRFDFKLSNDTGSYYIEVKGVTLVESGIARFPDAPTARGVKHLEELIQIKKSGIGAGVIFIIQRSDAFAFGPNDKTHKAFGDALRTAQKNGVDIWAFKCTVNKTGISIQHEVPVMLYN